MVRVDRQAPAGIKSDPGPSSKSQQAGTEYSVLQDGWASRRNTEGLISMEGPEHKWHKIGDTLGNA